MANIFHIERNDNKITLGTTGTTINIASHTASQSLALDASKNLVSVDLGAVYQPLDAVLTDLAALDVVADNEFIVGTGAGTYAHESGDTVRTSLGLAIGTNVQAWDASLDSIAALTYVSDSFIKVTAEDTYAIRTIAEVKTDLSLNNVENTAHSTDAHTMTIDGRDVSVDGTKLDGIEALADVTSNNETSHADVVVDGDFASNGILNRTGAGVYSILALGTDVQAYHANLASVAGLTYAAAAFVKMTGANTFALRTIGEAADDLEATIDHDNLANGGAHDYAYISGNDAGTGITAAELEELSDGSETTLHSHAAGTDEKVKIDAAATAGYLGAASNDGVLRTTTGLSYADGGDFVTLGLSHLGFESLTSPTPNDRIPFWDDSASSFAWLSASTGISIDATAIGLNLGALIEETTPDNLDVVCIYDPTGGAHHKVQLGNLYHDGDGFRYVDVDGTPTKVYTKYLTGTLDADNLTLVAHGCTAANILHVSAICYDDNHSLYVAYDYYMAAAADHGFFLRYDATNIILAGVGAFLQGNAYRIKIDYTA